MTDKTLLDGLGAGFTYGFNLSLGRQAATAVKSVSLCNEDIALFPASLGTKLAAQSFAVTLASDGPLTTVTGTTADAAWSGSGNATNNALLKAIAANSLSTAPSPVILPGSYKPVAASQTNTVCGATGAVGDYLSHVLIIPATTSPGAVSITDGAGSAMTIFAGGANSVGSLVSFAAPVGAISASGAWKITTGANVSVIAFGKFT